MDSHRPLPVDQVRLVALDLDGTLLRSDGSLGPVCAEAVAATAAAGVKVVLATARPPRGIRHLCTQLGLDTLQINHNGALVFDPIRNAAIFHQPMPGALAQQVIGVARRYDPMVSVGVEVMDELFSDRAGPTLAGELSVDLTNAHVSPLDAVLRNPVTKVLILGQQEAVAKTQAELSVRGKDRLSFAFSHLRLLQVVHASADKGKALARVAEHYGVARSQVMAIGDAPNDLPMLQWAGHAVAMGNAWTPVRDAAHYCVPDNDHDGVAVALRRHVLGG